MMGLARLEFGWAECADSTYFVQTIFVQLAPYFSKHYVCLAFRFVHGSVTGEGTNWKTKLART